jgi:hypothetical protein
MVMPGPVDLRDIIPHDLFDLTQLAARKAVVLGQRYRRRNPELG